MMHISTAFGASITEFKYYIVDGGIVEDGSPEVSRYCEMYYLLSNVKEFHDFVVEELNLYSQALVMDDHQEQCDFIEIYGNEQHYEFMRTLRDSINTADELSEQFIDYHDVTGFAWDLYDFLVNWLDLDEIVDYRRLENVYINGDRVSVYLT